jgi:hypothetical protein
MGPPLYRRSIRKLEHCRRNAAQFEAVVETEWYGGPNNPKKADPALELLSLRTEQFRFEDALTSTFIVAPVCCVEDGVRRGVSQ